MPNTLAHIGIQTLVARSLIKSADVKWIWASCVIPDLPWILQRAIRTASPDISVYDVRLYAIAQSSLLVCLILCAALAAWSKRPSRTFAILGLGCLAHLVLDALQTKWGNGVHLFAPVSWDLLNFGLFWPEDMITWVLTAFGIGMALYAWMRLPRDVDDLRRPRGGWLTMTMAMLFLYALVPFCLIGDVAASNSHHVATLQSGDARTGQVVAFDRAKALPRPDAQSQRLLAWTRETFLLTADAPPMSGLVSLQGRFTDPQTIEITALHIHSTGVRGALSYIGLGLVMVWWIACAVCARRRRTGLW